MASVVLDPSWPKWVHYKVSKPLRYFKFECFRSQNSLSVNDLYSFIDKGTPSNEKAMDCDSFGQSPEERIAPGR